MNSCDARCTWNVVDGKNVSQAVIWSDKEKCLDIEDTIQAENCLLLEGSDDCKLLLSCAEPCCIKQVVLLSESRLVEVFGNHGEYLATVRGEMVDQVEDLYVYRVEIDFQQPVRECIIKFAALKDKSKMWLYGVTVQVQKTRPLLTQFLQRAPCKVLPQQPQSRADRSCQTELAQDEKEIQTVLVGQDEPRLGSQEQLMDSLSERIECCLEQMELRLWTKVEQRLQEMEQRLVLHIGQITDALAADEESSQEAALSET